MFCNKLTDSSPLSPSLVRRKLLFALHLPSQRQIDARSNRIEHKGFGETSVPGKIGGAAGGACGERGLRRTFNIFYFHAEMVNPLAPVARRKDRQIDMAVRQINRLAMFAGFTTASNLTKTERRLVKPREFFGVLRQQCDMSNACH